MSSSGGKRLLHYSLIDKIGAGGMGEVWKASDTTLGRDVAIKILPEELAADPERLARFDREARVLASMNHPNIAGIYGVHAADGVRFLAMELADGEELTQHISAGPLPIEDAVRIAIDIAAALEYAHDQGIVHRDLKPANVMIAPGGGVKVLDFGLAKALFGDSADPVTSAGMPTITSVGTRMGTILGTAAYMSPEQARGRPVDRRSDIWAFGCVFYEMLTGRRAFEGETNSDTLAAVLRQDVDWAALPANTPAELRRLLRRCLVRDPRQRLHDIGDARIILEEIAQGSDEAPAAAKVPSRRPLALLAAAFALGGLAGFGMSFLQSSRMRPTTPMSIPPVLFRQLTTVAGGEGEPSLAPDGQSFAFVKEEDKQADIFVQRVDGRNAQNLTKGCTEGDAQPAFSPDGQRIAFRSERSGGGIFVMGATGENVRRVADFGFNPSWSPDGRELAVVTEGLGVPWGRVSQSKLWAVNVESGARRLITNLDAMQPAWSPNGQFIAFWGLDRDKSSFQRDLWIVPAASDTTQPNAAVRLTEDGALDWSPTWAPDGKTLYFASTRGGTMNMWTLAMDAATGRTQGEPTPLTAPSSWVGWLSVSHRGDRIAFVDRNARTVVHRAPFDPNRGVITGRPMPIPLGTMEVYENFDLSPDGETVLVTNVGLPQHLFAARTDGTEFRQLTDGEHRDRQARFSNDGQWIAFQTTRFPSRLGIVRADGSGLRGLISDETAGWYPTWSPDGKQVIVATEHGAYVLDVNATTPAGSTRKLPPTPQSFLFMPTSWSKDGSTVLGQATDPSSSSRGILSLSMATSTFRTLRGRAYSGPTQASLLPDGRNFVFTSDDKLLLQDLESGEMREILAAPAGHIYPDVALSADGRWIAFLEVWDESDIWLGELAPQGAVR